MTVRTLAPTGTLAATPIRAPRAPLSWRLRNVLRWSFLTAWLGARLAKLFSRLTGVTTLTAELIARLVRADGSVVDYGVLSYRMVTDAGVAALVDDWDSDAKDMTAFNYHGCGTGAVAEAVGDTALGAEVTTALNPDSTRPAGTKSQPVANQLRTVATVSFDAPAAITEHGLFNQAAVPGGDLWDRSVFAAINVGNGDSIQFQYTLTVNAGG